MADTEVAPHGLKGRRSSSKRDLLAHFRAPLYRNAYALILSDLTTSALGLAYWALAARGYTTDQVGLNSLAISTMALLAGVSQLTLMGLLLRFIPHAGYATGRLVAGVYLGAAAGTVVAGLLFLYGLDPIAVKVFDGYDHVFKLALVAAAVTWCVFSLQDNALAGLRAAGWVPIKNVIYCLAKIGLLAALAISPGDFGIFASWVLPAAVLLIPGNLLMFGRLIPRHAKATAADATKLVRGQLVRYAAGDSLGSIFNLMSVALLPLIVTHKAGTTANAYFYLPWTVAYSLQLVAYNLGTSLTVEGAADEAELSRYSRKMLVYMVRLLVPLAIVVALGAPLILRVFGESYEREGTQLLQLLALAPIPSLVTILVMAVARVQGRTTLIASIRGLLCVLLLGLSLVLVPQMGIVGAGVASLLANTVVAIVVGLPLLHRILRPREADPVALQDDRVVLQRRTVRGASPRILRSGGRHGLPLGDPHVKPLISVITPAHNAEAFIGDAIDSVSRQTEQRFEYLVVENGSTDATQEVARARLDKMDGAQLLSTPNSGQGAARNLGLEHSNGDYVAFLDADDVWYPDMLRRSLHALQTADPTVGAVFCHSHLVLADGTLVGRLRPRPGAYDLGDLLIGGCPPGNGSCLLVRRTCFEEAGPFDETMRSAVDFEMWARIAVRASTPTFWCFPEPLVQYRLHAGSISGALASRLGSPARLAGLDEVLVRYVGRLHRPETRARAHIAPAIFAFEGGDERRARAWSREALRLGRGALARDPLGRRLLTWLAAGSVGRRGMRIVRQWRLNLAIAAVRSPSVAELVARFRS